MPYQVVQTRRFARVYKKLLPGLQASVDQAVDLVANDPNLGERKKGDLAKLWVYKFNVGGQLYLLGYTRDDQIRFVMLEALGSHENFYRDIKRQSP